MGAGDPGQGASLRFPRMGSEGPQGVRRKADDRQPARELQTAPAGHGMDVDGGSNLEGTEEAPQAARAPTETPGKQQARACQHPRTCLYRRVPGPGLGAGAARAAGGRGEETAMRAVRGSRQPAGGGGGALSSETALVAQASVTLPAKAGEGGGGYHLSSYSCWAGAAGRPPGRGLSRCCRGWRWGPGTRSFSRR